MVIHAWSTWSVMSYVPIVCMLIRVFVVYSIITELPAVFLLYDSKTWSAVYLMVLFSVCVWNGGGFYIEVFGRKCVFRNLGLYTLNSSVYRFERQLEALRKELAEAYARSSSSAPTSPTLAAQSDDGLSTVGNSPSLEPVPDKAVPQVESPLETVPDLIVVPAEEETKKDR